MDVIHEIQFDNVSYDYMSEKPVRAVDNVSLEVNKGEFICVIGHNGSGKSTLAKHINALFTPTLGKVLVCGMDSSEENDTWLIRSKAGMVFQNPDNQIVSTTVEEDVAFGLENLGVPQEEMAERIKAALEAVGMLDRIKSEPHMLSGGQKQRVAIAGIIAMRPEIIVMDEPTAMLDPRGRQEVLTTVHILNKEFGITIVLITHFMEEAMNADRVVVMDKGRIMLDGTPAEVFSHIDELHEVGLDIPPSARLANYLKKHGIDLPNLLSVDEMVDKLCRLF